MNIVNDTIKNLIKKNGSKFFTVEFTKKDGTIRLLNGSVRHVVGHNGKNSVAHIDKYVTMVLSQKSEDGKVQFRNVNVETIRALHIAGKRIIVG